MPSYEFRLRCDDEKVSKFKGSMQGLMDMGLRYINSERFKPLGGEGKPLWEFKEHDHRLYCHREVRGDFVHAILLNGWVKGKEKGKLQETREIERAKSLLAEYLTEGG